MRDIKTILRVEDNPGAACLLIEMFKKQDSAHITLTNENFVRDAEVMLKLLATDVVLLDQGLPDTAELEGVRQITLATEVRRWIAK